MPRIEKKGTFEATWARDDEQIKNERTGKDGKSMGRLIRITHVEKKRSWFVSPAEFEESGWGAVDATYESYYLEPPP